jgi:hypothetical protein
MTREAVTIALQIEWLGQETALPVDWTLHQTYQNREPEDSIKNKSSRLGRRERTVAGKTDKKRHKIKLRMLPY